MSLNLNVIIDNASGFCFGVVYAIEMAEDILLNDEYLYCLGDIVHNDEEVNRLKAKGLIIIDHDALMELKDEKVLSMMDKLEFAVDNEMESQFPAKRLSWVEIKLKNGKILKSAVFSAPGEASDNVDHNWIVDKFIRITGPLISLEKQKRILDTLSVPSEKSMRQVVDVINRG